MGAWGAGGCEDRPASEWGTSAVTPPSRPRAETRGREWGGQAPGTFPPLLPVSNLVKAATHEGEGRSFGEPRNSASSGRVARDPEGAAEGLLRRREVTEEEAER